MYPYTFTHTTIDLIYTADETYILYKFMHVSGMYPGKV